MKWMVLALCLAGCSGGDQSDEDRLIQRNDSQFTVFERPESDNECAAPTDCEHSCVHSCVPKDNGPMTCPVEPTPTPERLVGATCTCADARCKWL